jgi:hypothetical protein
MNMRGGEENEAEDPFLQGAARRGEARVGKEENTSSRSVRMCLLMSALLLSTCRGIGIGSAFPLHSVRPPDLNSAMYVPTFNV